MASSLKPPLGPFDCLPTQPTVERTENMKHIFPLIAALLLERVLTLHAAH
jgi:hypothetical protein